MAHGTIATRTTESIEKELEQRAAKNDPFAWYVFRQLDEYDRADLLERVRHLAVHVRGMGVLSAFELLFRASVYQALHIEKPWVVHDLRKQSDEFEARNKHCKRNGHK